jgi:hypothetical protein
MRLGDATIFPWELGDGDALTAIDVAGPVTTNETEASVTGPQRVHHSPSTVIRAGASRRRNCGKSLG